MHNLTSHLRKNFTDQFHQAARRYYSDFQQHMYICWEDAFAKLGTATSPNCCPKPESGDFLDNNVLSGF